MLSSFQNDNETEFSTFYTGPKRCITFASLTGAYYFLYSMCLLELMTEKICIYKYFNIFSKMSSLANSAYVLYFPRKIIVM